MFLLFYGFEIICKHLRDAFILFPDVIIYGFWFIIGSNKSFKFSVLLKNEVFIKCNVIILFLYFII